MLVTSGTCLMNLAHKSIGKFELKSSTCKGASVCHLERVKFACDNCVYV